MGLDTLLRSDRVFLDLEAENRSDALAQMAVHVSAVVGHGARRIQMALEERERLGSTALGDGFAIPHCKLDGARSVTVCFFRYRGPVSMDLGDDLRCAIVVVSPPENPALHLQALAVLARVLKHASVRGALMEARDPESVVAILRNGPESDGGLLR